MYGCDILYWGSNYLNKSVRKLQQVATTRSNRQSQFVCIYSQTLYRAISSFSFGVVVFCRRQNIKKKVTMDPVKLAKLQAQAASNRIGELISPSNSTKCANLSLLLVYLTI